MIYRLSVLLIITFFSSITFAQKATLRGYVYDVDTGEPLVYASVFVQQANLGTSTDINGFYNISNIAEGSYNVIVQMFGYDSLALNLDLKQGIYNKSFYLKQAEFSINEVVVSAEKNRARTEVQISKIAITPKQIKKLPSVSGDADLAQYLQVLPGIVSTGDQGGQLFIRGGAPVQNKILLDGLNIYNPFHSLGLFSVFETEVIRNVDVYTGGFNAEYGGRTSAIIDIKTKEGNKTRLGGYASASPFMTKLLVETPLAKFEEGKGSTSLIITGKKSLIENTSKSIYKNASAVDSIGMPFSFQDFYSKLSFVSSSGSKVNIFGFNFNDAYNNPLVSNIGWQNSGVGSDFTLIPSGSNLIIKGTIGYSKYDLGIKESLDKRKSSIGEFGANVDFAIYKNKSEFKYGFDLKAVSTDFTFVNPFAILLNQNQNTTEISFYTKYKQTIGRLILEPSIRAMYYASQARLSPEPRLGLKFAISDKIRFKAAGGFYSQNILSTNNERDVVNLFYGFLTSPEQQVLGLDGKLIDNKLQLAKHAIAGFEIDPLENMVVNIEGYFKDFNQIIAVNRNKTNVTQPDYIVESGEAYGIDCSVKYTTQKFDVYTTYTYGFVNRFDGVQTYPTVFDRRHNLNFLANYNFDKTGDFNLGLRWNLGSGFPFTKTQGFFNQLNFGQGPDTKYEVLNPEQVGIIYSQIRNGGRLPYYHRLDLALTKKYNFDKYKFLELTASVTNAYNRENIFYFDRIRYSRVNQLPLLPALAVKFGF